MSDDHLITLVQNTLANTVMLLERTVQRCQVADQTFEATRLGIQKRHALKETTIRSQLDQELDTHEQVYEQAMKQALDTWTANSDRLATQADEQKQEILDKSGAFHRTAAEAAENETWDTDSDYEMSVDVVQQELARTTKHLEEAQWRETNLLEQVSTLRRALGVKAEAPHTAPDPKPSPERSSVENVDRFLDRADKCVTRVKGTTRQRFMRHFNQFIGGGIPLAAGIAIGILTERMVLSISVGGVIGLIILVGMRIRARRKRRWLLSAAERLAAKGVALAERRFRITSSNHAQIVSKSRQFRDSKRKSTREQLAERIESAAPRTQRKLESLEVHYSETLSEARSRRAKAEQEAVADREGSVSASTAHAEDAHRSLQASTETAITAATEAHAAEWSDVIDGWARDQDQIQADLKHIAELQNGLAPHWPSWDANWASHSLPETFAGNIGIGRLRCGLNELPSGLPEDPRLAWTGPAVLELPAVIDFQGRGSLVIETNEQSHAEGIAIMQAQLARVLTTIPAGQVHLTLYDPIGLGQNFAGFMHLADSDETPVLKRVLTEPMHLESKLNDITEHMETVIQAYLRNEYESLEAYNKAAGQIEEPYHLLVLTDFPQGITDNAVKRIASILTSGPRCGVFACMLIDTTKKTPPLLQELDWNSNRVRLGKGDNGWRITEPPLGDFEFIPDHPPDDSTLTTIVQRVGEVASDTHRVEVPFELITPTEAEQWTRSSTDELRVTLGQSGANRFQELRLGRGTTQHALVAGRTGSGKSTLLHVLITNMALWYSPDELELHLIDFKKGVEFQTYAAHTLPHARVIAIESDREFGLSVLRRLDEELRRRGDLFREAGVQDVAGWRSHRDDPMPRVLLIVDEFQEFFVDDDALAQEAGLLLDRLVRQGRAFGIHVLMGSQTLDGAFSLARSTLGQMGVRIALQCAEADSYLILSDENPAARLLRRPGEAIYNDAGGKIEGNSPFQVVWLDDSQRDDALDAVATLDADRFPDAKRDQFVFKGNIPSLLHTDQNIETMVAATRWPASAPLDITMGDPIAVTPQTMLPLRNRTSCNILFVGQHPESGNALLTAALLQAAATLPPTTSPDQHGLMVWIFDGTPSDALFAGRIASFGEDLPHQVTRVTTKNIENEMQILADILASRSDGDHTNRATILLLGLQAHRIAPLRFAEDDFSFSPEESAMRPDKQFADILRDGPLVGIHSLLWFDGLNNLNRCLSRANQREFDLKVLFQMSSNDSAQLIDTTAAADLGGNRALLHLDDIGSIEKFRPWAMPDEQWLAETAARLSGRRHKGR